VSLEINNSENVLDLESQLLNNTNATDFPNIPKDMLDNTKLYPDKYDTLKTKLGSKHDLVGIMSILCSLEQEIKNNTISDELYDKIILLNKHGKAHVESVISRASDLAKCIDEKNKLSPFEIFILLCAIQIHDIGNIYGRDEHATSFKNDFERYAKESFINASVLIECIFNIAKVHGGKINDNNDTIEAARLHYKTTVLQMDIRQRLLAAVLRFADELADDNTRSLDIDISEVPEYSKIYHAYSSSLHTVKIEKIDKENAYFIKLCYFMSIQQALCNYKKLKKENDGSFVSISLPLIREIIERTKKMERERRYCSHHFIPYIILKHIKVVIEIGSLDGENMIEYTLEESGYPNENIELPSSIEDSIASLEREYATVKGTI
jgi:hypothetical protein